MARRVNAATFVTGFAGAGVLAGVAFTLSLGAGATGATIGLGAFVDVGAAVGVAGPSDLRLACGITTVAGLLFAVVAGLARAQYPIATSDAIAGKWKLRVQKCELHERTTASVRHVQTGGDRPIVDRKQQALTADEALNEGIGLDFSDVLGHFLNLLVQELDERMVSAQHCLCVFQSTLGEEIHNL